MAKRKAITGRSSHGTWKTGHVDQAEGRSEENFETP